MERLTIDFEYKNECLMCGKPKAVGKVITQVSDEMYEVDYRLFHPGCRRLRERRDKLRKELADVEFKILKKFINEE